MAIFYPFLDPSRSELPTQQSGNHRLISYLGALGKADLSPGPALDSDSPDMFLGILTLLGVNLPSLQPQQRGETTSRLAWLDAAQVVAITPALAFALDEEIARRFLLELKEAVELLMALRPQYEGGCLLQVIDARP